MGDGVEFMRRHKAEFDVVIVDSTDPVGMAEGLFGERFYRDVKAALRGRGLMVAQTESPFFGFETWKRIFGELGRAFRKVRGYHAAIPMYPSGHWTFAFASDELEPQTCFDRRRADALSGLRYYTAGLQRGAFLMPAYARGIVDLEPGDV